jgi:DNA invertase Pin-like site-specific DNA recombinase
VRASMRSTEALCIPPGSIRRAPVALGQVGIVLSYESTRLSRNCTDWSPLLDLWAYNQCLIADRDGVYDAATPNGRLLLGMQGMVSEVELHTVRGRLIAGVQQKAQRGDLALALPAGLVRQDDGVVVQDPDRAVQHAITLVFQTFLERRSASQVVRLLREQGLCLPRRHRNRETVWRLPTVAVVIAILRNPAYAGTLAYGKTQTQVPRAPCRRGRSSVRRPSNARPGAARAPGAGAPAGSGVGALEQSNMGQPRSSRRSSHHVMPRDGGTPSST